MPIFEYRCPEGHTVQRLRKYDDRDAIVTCSCGRQSARLEISAPHIVPDGVYSYAPNIGSATAFEKRRIAMRDGQRLLRKSDLLSDS